MKNLDIYLALITTSIRARMEYKSSFIFYIFAILAYYAAQIGILLVVLSKFKTINGWDVGEIAFLYGLLTFAQGFTQLFFSSLVHFDQTLIKGEFDRTLVRPLSPLAQIIFSQFEASTIAHFLLGAGALIFGSQMSGIEWTLQKALFLPLVIIGGVLISGAIRLMVTAVAFWTLKNESLVHTILFSSKEFVIYPITIYSSGMQFFLTFVFPIAFINFYPAHYFLGHNDGELLYPILQLGTPLVGVILFSISLVVWKKGVDQYQSSGS